MLQFKPKENKETMLTKEMKNRGAENRVYVTGDVILLLQK